MVNLEKEMRALSIKEDLYYITCVGNGTVLT